MTPTASVEAFQDNVNEVVVIAEEAKPFGFVGAVVSGGGNVVTPNVPEKRLLFPAAS